MAGLSTPHTVLMNVWDQRSVHGLQDTFHRASWERSHKRIVRPCNLSRALFGDVSQVDSTPARGWHHLFPILKIRHCWLPVAMACQTRHRLGLTPRPRTLSAWSPLP